MDIDYKFLYLILKAVGTKIFLQVNKINLHINEVHNDH